jgi:hypothetical protein
METSVRHSGGCICGAVRFTTAGEPSRVTICHCTWCQRRTGTAFGTEVVFNSEQVEITGPEIGRYRHVSDGSGRWLDVEFCRRCGSNLGFTLEAVPGVRALPAGAFDDPTWIRSERYKFRHVFLRSRREWSDLSPHVEMYERHFRP